MRRWGIAFLAVLLACVPILLSRATSAGLLADSDTGVLLATVRQRNAPLSWFVGDWPLGNHFYRPVSTLAFELDNRLYGNVASGYGLTNALLCVACVLLLFWFVRELTDRPFVASASAVLFALWHTSVPSFLFPSVAALTWITLAAGVWRHHKRWRSYLPAVFALLYFPVELSGMRPLQSIMLGWLPGRTASTMTVFALLAMAAYARYERICAMREPRAAPGPLDPPATRTTRILATKEPMAPWVWAIVSVAGTLLALASYEQAVMLPAALLGVAVSFRLAGYRPRWGWQVAFWGCLAGYLVLRKLVIPAGESSYQAQQMRSSFGGAAIVLEGYVFPAIGYLPAFWSEIQNGPIVWLNPLFVGSLGPWSLLVSLAENVSTVVVARREWILALTGYLLSILTFLPMAFVKEFGHYHYWPMAMRSLFVVALLLALKDAVLSAWSPRPQQAPARPTPAPGSLPRP